MCPGPLPARQPALTSGMARPQRRTTDTVDLTRQKLKSNQYDDATAFGINLIREGSYSKAKEHFLSKQDLGYLALYGAAQASYYLKEYDECLSYLVSALKDATEDPWVYNMLGFVYLAKKQYLLAKGSFETSLKLVDDPWAHYGMAALYEATMNFKAARKIYEAIQGQGRVGLLAQKGLERTSKSKFSEFDRYEIFAAKESGTTRISAEFNASIYRWLYEDLVGLSAEELLTHFTTHGRIEGRIASERAAHTKLQELLQQCPSSFSVQAYLALNPELRALTEQAPHRIVAEYRLVKHYAEYGKDEGRPISFIDRKDEMSVEDKNYHINRYQKDLQHFLSGEKRLELGTKKSKPVLSIIIVVYNKPHFLYRCLNSILLSTFENYEVIIVDNASKKETHEIYSRLDGEVKVIKNQRNVHFLLAANQAAKEARGEYLVFLNSDAFLEASTLAELVYSFQRHTHADIIGGQVLHLDGHLQEAGSVIFSDASCRGVGRRMRPDVHMFSFDRYVDYVSGACFGVKRATWEKMGGFDEEFAPAYYEESDFCARAWQRNLKVLYTPRIKIYHFEFGSSDKSSSYLDLQKKNQKVFLQKHKNWLVGNQSPSAYNEFSLTAAGRYDTYRRRILFIDDVPPVASWGAGISRAFTILEQMVDMNCFVSHFSTNLKNPAMLSQLDQKFSSVEFIHGGDAYLEYLMEARSGFYDVIFCSRPHNISRLKNILAKTKISPPRLVYDAEAVFAVRDVQLDYFLATEKHFSNNDSRIFKELELYADARCLTVVSPREVPLFRSTFPNARIEVLSHTFEPGELVNLKKNKNKVLFLGAIHGTDAPNYDSVMFILTFIAPRLLSVCPEVEISIAGNVSSVAIKDQLEELCQQTKNVKFLGKVENLKELVAGYDAFLAPTRLAAGLPHKVQEMASLGLPCIITPVLAQQLGWDNGKHCLIASSPSEYVDSIASLTGNAKLRHALRDAANAELQENHSCEKFGKTLEKVLFD